MSKAGSKKENMRFIITVILTFTFYSFLFSQTEAIDDIVNRGIALFEAGKYQESVNEYEKALSLDSNSPLVNYEIAYSYFVMGEHEKAIMHIDRILKIKSKFQNLAYIVKGSCYDEMKKTKKAIKTYKAGIKKYPEDHLLRYNLALTYYRSKAYEAAEYELIEGIYANSIHASSHLLLAKLNKEQGKRIPSILSLYFFLLLEPDTGRSKDALKMLEDQVYNRVRKKEGNSFEISIGSPDLEDDFSTVNMMLSLKAAMNVSEDKGNKTKAELFVETTENLFSILKETSEDKVGVYWDVYVHLYTQILESDHLEAYCYYISQSKGEILQNWFDENEQSFNSFTKWISE